MYVLHRNKLFYCKSKRRKAEIMKKIPHEEIISYPQRVLFLCTHNSARSQMAEALLRLRGGDYYDAYSAGIAPGVLHPLTVKVMTELGIDISNTTRYRAKHLNEFLDQPPMDLVVTVCDRAAEQCPSFPHARRQVHWGFPDPSLAIGSEREQIAVFRHIRDLIAMRITQFLREQDLPSLSNKR